MQILTTKSLAALSAELGGPAELPPPLGIKTTYEPEPVKHFITKDYPRTLHFKIFKPGNKSFERLAVQCPKGKRFTEQVIETALRKATDKCEELHPGHEYDLLPLRDGSYNIVWLSGPAENAPNESEA